MGVLFVKPQIPTPGSDDAHPLLCFNEKSITEHRRVMPTFDEWGIVPRGHRGPRPNPWVRAGGREEGLRADVAFGETFFFF